MARVAEPMRPLFAQSYLQPGDDEEELALRYGDRVYALMPLAAADLDYMLRMHLRDFARSDAISDAARASGRLPEANEVAVAFADIVGFTALGEEIPEDALTDIAEPARSARRGARRQPGPARQDDRRRGDGRVPRPAALIAAMVALAEAAEADAELPSLRTGIAYGRAVGRLGDCYGPTVNLAARLTQRARPDSILVTNSLRDALGDAAEDYSFSEAGMKRFKGIPEPVPVLRLRSGSDADDGLNDLDRLRAAAPVEGVGRTEAAARAAPQARHDAVLAREIGGIATLKRAMPLARCARADALGGRLPSLSRYSATGRRGAVPSPSRSAASRARRGPRRSPCT